MKASIEDILEESAALLDKLDMWCMALHGNHDEHQCHKKPGHEKVVKGKEYDQMEQSTVHECHCGVWWWW